MLGDARGCCNWGLGAKGGGYSRHIHGCWVDNNGFLKLNSLINSSTESPEVYLCSSTNRIFFFPYNSSSTQQNPENPSHLTENSLYRAGKC